MTLSGRDAVAFAQAQFMSDVATLAPGHWHWSGWLTPKGRVIALFAVLRRDAESLYVLLHDADPAAFVSSLQRFVFRSKVMIGIDRDAHVSGALRIPSVARGHEAHIDGELAGFAHYTQQDDVVVMDHTETEDGFTIAEEDLRLRGPGELLGQRQSGLPRLRFADLEAHRDLLPLARAQAKAALEASYAGGGAPDEALRTLLHLFERHEAVTSLAAG